MFDCDPRFCWVTDDIIKYNWYNGLRLIYIVKTEWRYIVTYLFSKFLNIQPKIKTKNKWIRMKPLNLGFFNEIYAHQKEKLILIVLKI